jgi:hypothetical protein
MARDKPPHAKSRSYMIGVRVDDEQKALVEQAAEREGLQVSSFIIMLLVRLHILPASSMDKIKRRPVPFYSALHELLGVVNKIGGNCKQLAAALPEMNGLHGTHSRLILAAAVITEKLQGYQMPEGVNLYRLHQGITAEGHRFNQIVKSVNSGQPNLAGLPACLAIIRQEADRITAALTGEPQEINSVLADTDIMEKAMEEMRVNMRKAAAEQASRKNGDA